MSNKTLEIFCYALLVLSISSFCAARPPQGFNEQATQAIGGGSEDLSSRQLLDADDLTALKMQLLAQKLAEYNALQPLGPETGISDRFVLSKRQQRYRQCYFNPISCFRK